MTFRDIEMKIEITNRCLYGRCKFCSPLFRPAVKEAETGLFLDRLEKHLNSYFRGGGRRVILTGGGEPIDAPDKLFGTLELIERTCSELGVELELLTVFTNGVRILSQISLNSSETYLDRLVQLGVKDINLSIHSDAPTERTCISGTAMGAIDIDTLIPSIIQRGVRVMTRTTLVRGGIDSVRKLDAFACHMDALGVHLAYFSDLFHIPVRNQQTTPGSRRVLMWTDAHRIAFDNLLAELSSHENFELLTETRRHNFQGRTFVFRRKGIGLRVMLGDLVIGNESSDLPTYAYVKPDGSSGQHNNARNPNARSYVSPEDFVSYLGAFRPGREDL